MMTSYLPMCNIFFFDACRMLITETNYCDQIDIFIAIRSIAIFPKQHHKILCILKLFLVIKNFVIQSNRVI